MKHAIGIWNFATTPGSVPQTIREFADSGFDCVSLKPINLLECGRQELESINAALNEFDLPVTVHGDLGMPIEDVKTMLKVLNGRLACLSLDPRCRIDPDGAFFSAQKYLPLLEWLMDVHSEFELEFCIEDFPLDKRALRNNESSLNRILSCPAFGILVDLGHMNLRVVNGPHFTGLRYSEYIANIPVPIKELHLHDNTGQGDKHMPVGHGNIDFSNVVDGLKDKDFDGFCTVEVAPRLYGRKAHEEVGNAIASMRKFRSLWAEPTVS